MNKQTIDFNNYQLSKRVINRRPNTSFGIIVTRYFNNTAMDAVVIHKDIIELRTKNTKRYLFINKRCFLANDYKDSIFYVDLNLLTEKMRCELLSVIILRYGNRNIFHTQNPFLRSLDVCEFETLQAVKNIKDKKQLLRAYKQLDKIKMFKNRNEVREPSRLQHLIFENRHRIENAFMPYGGLSAEYIRFTRSS